LKILIIYNTIYDNYLFYRRSNVQAGDIVESVDMEMSDEENENKQKANRVLVDVRSQDRDMRVSNMLPASSSGSHHHAADMDMRLMSTGGNNMNAMVQIFYYNTLFVYLTNEYLHNDSFIIVNFIIVILTEIINSY
jgi:hypothetical protein